MTMQQPSDYYDRENNRFIRRVYQKKQGLILGRKGPELAKIGLFYLIFYGMLAALVAVCMWVFFQTLDPRIPKWQLDESLIGTNPGLGFRPMPEKNEESTLIWFQGSNKTSYSYWVENILKFLDKYYVPSKIAKGNGQIKTCSHHDYPTSGEVCEVDVRDWEECNRDQFFNYHKNSPCIFIKLNKIYNWEPMYYDDPYDLPEEMPDNLKQHIRGINNTRELRNVWVSCQGENPADVEYLGPITYYPRSVQGFPGYYFPYLNSEGYLSPLVAVKFERPVAGIVINVECRAWARNILYNRADRTGSVHFELLID
ncbi:sodium/potassium-transporting ATPase subunit beta-2-like isoform X2 [Diabrotica virgifera virgifera]|uniref:Sodium/potassium-transporting ATPase subunit beta-2-like n=1 Tax=Diabrotica virgifera virgifera TaxID=50390 RepID=A0A6P7GHB4_DIAVI|nr:sodium/potassium-transporting ATPase subunit beta-2-like isoform X2 [Diabrotica virgifera virgifera]